MAATPGARSRALGDRATGAKGLIIERSGADPAERVEGSPRRPGNAWRGARPTGRPGSCRCMTPTPARSPRVGSASRSSSATRRSSSTTKTASSSTTTSRRGNPPDAPDARAGDRADRPPPGGRPGRSPRIAATAKPTSKTTSATPVCATSCCHERQTQRRPPPGREPPRVPQDGPLAHRLRRTDQLRQTRLRAQPHPHRRPHRRPNLVRTRHLRPQPHQDQRPHAMNNPNPAREPGSAEPHRATPHHSTSFFRSK